MHKLIFTLAACLGVTVAVYGQDFIYTPVNPAFGGNTLNYSWLLNQANSQDSFKDPNLEDDGASSDLDQLTSTLERQLFREFTDSLTDPDTGEPIEEGLYQFGDFQVEVSPGLTGLIIVITDFVTGAQSTITVPYF